jgi:hypothetical protein
MIFLRAKPPRGTKDGDLGNLTAWASIGWSMDDIPTHREPVFHLVAANG